MKKIIVYAMSDESGIFEELITLNKNEIIQDEIETEDGTYICECILEGENDSFFYLSKVEISIEEE